MNNLKNLPAKERLSIVKQSKDITAVIAGIKEILDDCPRYVSGWIELGLAYRKQKDRLLALKTFESALQLHPYHQRIRLELSAEQLYLNKIKDCRQNLDKLLEIAPNNVRGIVILGKACLKDSQKLLAVDLFKKALELNPKAIEASIHLTKQLRELERFDEAIEHLEKALVHFPNHFHLLINIGELEKKNRRLELALEYFQKAIAVHPEKIRSYICKVNTLWDLGRFDEAKNNLGTLRDRYPDNFQILVLSGYLARKSGQRKQALQWFRLAQTKASTPNQALKSHVLLTEELRALGFLDEALELIESAINQHPNDLSFLTAKGSILQRQPNLTEAAKIYQHILSIDPNHFDSRLELAKIYSQSGQVEKAIYLLEETDRLLGANIKTYIQLGSLYQALENQEIAEFWYKKAYQEYPEHPQGYIKLANLLFFKGDSEAAIKLLREARVKMPHVTQIALESIEIQMRLGNLDLGERLLVEELEHYPNNVQLLWKLCQLKTKQGEYPAAHHALDRISTDNPEWLRRTEQLRTTICFSQYDYKPAEEHIRKAIALTPAAVSERVRLASLLSLTGRIEEAHRELKIATEKLLLKTSAGKSSVPLKSTTAMIINLLRSNPPLMKRLLVAEQKTGQEKILALGNLLAEEPSYLGSALYLAKELREQGVFDRLQQALLNKSTEITSIPRKIVQFWDNPEPSLEIRKICQSWIDLNPEYEYQLFSLDTAISFLEEHYDDRVIEAFANCDQPATQADFFRLAYLNKMGGFYADVDDLCLQPLDSIVNIKPELVILQEDVVTFGNNFLGCIPGQSIISTALAQVVDNLSDYCNESPWSATGPGLVTSVVCSSLIPYLNDANYQVWPRLLVLTTAQFKKMINSHMFLPYKTTDKSWSHQACKRRIKTLSLSHS